MSEKRRSPVNITTNPKTPKNQASPANTAVMLAQKTALVLALSNKFGAGK